MQSKLENEIAQEQAGFRPKRGTRDQIANIRIILEKAKEINQPLYFCFVDFTKAFDMVRHSQLWICMLDMGFPHHLVQILRNLYKQQQASVKINNILSDKFRVKRGVRQGCNLSPCLFNILAEQVMRKALHGYKDGFRIGGRIINNLRYADDIVLVSTSVDKLQELVQRVESAAKEYNLLINASKTKVMTNTNDVIKIKVGDNELEQVDTFVYLGSSIRADADSSKEVKARLTMGMAAMHKVTIIWKNKYVSKDTKIRLMKVLVWPVATYGCESWTLKKDDEYRIQAFENKCLRMLMRISWTQYMPNQGLYKMANYQPELLRHIKSRKLRFYGHIVRQPSDSIELSVLTGLVEGQRKRGKPAMCWIDNIKL